MSANTTAPTLSVVAEDTAPVQLHPCACRAVLVDGQPTSCARVTKRTFAPGHDAQLKSRLIAAAVSGAEVAWVADPETPVSVAEVAGVHGFGYLVAAGIARAQRLASEKADRRAARDAVREANAVTRAAAKQQAAEKRAATKAADAKPVQAKVGRWTFPGTVVADGSFAYVTKSGQAKVAKSGSYELV